MLMSVHVHRNIAFSEARHDEWADPASSAARVSRDGLPGGRGRRAYWATVSRRAVRTVERPRGSLAHGMESAVTPHADGWNRRMQQALRRRLRRFVVLEAVGALQCWREEMLLVAGDPQPRIRLAGRFRQRAVVILRRGQKARLRPV
jgi:Protein of unknown function (DUF3293)